MAKSIVQQDVTVVKVSAGASSAGVDTFGEKGIEQGNDAKTPASRPPQIGSTSVVTGSF